jgi:hypothetical protein
MCTKCNEDPRDELAYAVNALAGIRDLVGDIGSERTQFHMVGPRELAELLRMVSDRLEPAVEKLQGYVPRA